MTADEVLLSAHIPFTQQLEFTREFKQSPRRDDDIAIVNAGKTGVMASRIVGVYRLCEASARTAL